MTSFEKYVLILCLIVFVLLTGVFSALIIHKAKLFVRLIRSGAEDQRIYGEYLKAKKRGKKNEAGWFSKALSVFFACVVVLVLGATVYLQIVEDKVNSAIPVPRVVYSDSMSAKYEKNTYLFENNLNNHFSRFDIVLTHALPKEEDLKLYDIVVYEVDNVLLIHRIVGIEEPNEKHPSERYFLLQGDLVEKADKFPVRYSQMKAIYRGEKLRFVGSFVMFLQSPAGYICILLILLEMFLSPLMEKKIVKEEEARLAFILANRKKQAVAKATQKTVQNAVEGKPIPVNGALAGYIKLLPVTDFSKPIDLAELEKRYK